MPFLALVHLRELRCAQCNELLAAAGSRSFIVDGAGDPILFSDDEPPGEMTAVINCSRGDENVLYVPNEIAAEDVANTPDDAPIAVDALFRAEMP